MMIQAHEVTYHYNKVQALQQVDLEIQKGELFGLIGPDGAGKTTLMRLLMTLLKVQEGHLDLNGWDVTKDYREIRQHVGYMPGRFSLYPDLSVYENLTFFASVFGTSLEENYDQIKKIYSQIEPFKNRRAGQLSGGMKQKLALSCALVHKPLVLILDEPTTGVDAVSRMEFWEILQELKKEGITILVSTPYMDEASLCDRIGLMYDGKILETNTVHEIEKLYNGNLFALSVENKHATIKKLRPLPKVDSIQVFGQYLHLNTAMNSPQEVQKFLNDVGISANSIKAIQPNIENVFIQRTEKKEIYE